MPFKSQAQRAYMHIHHPDLASKWESEYPNQGKLPEHVKKEKAPSSVEERALAHTQKHGRR